jgi:hypothetical protein
MNEGALEYVRRLGSNNTTCSVKLREFAPLEFQREDTMNLRVLGATSKYVLPFTLHFHRANAEIVQVFEHSLKSRT